MPIKLIDPRPGKTPNYYIRGTYRGHYVDESTSTARKDEALKYRRAVTDAIDRGVHQSKQALKADPTFLDAVLSYVQAGGERRFLGVFDEETGKWERGIVTHFAETKLKDIDQRAIDDAAVTLYPEATPATRNRQVYTPVSAILRHAGVERTIRRPKGAQGRQKNDWMLPERAFRLLAAADAVDPEFGIFCAFLCYTGARLSDGLDLTTDRLIITEEFAYFEQTKNDDPRGVYLPPYLVTRLASHPRGLEREGKVFRFTKCGRLYSLLAKAKTAAGPDCASVSFHTFCHTWATWMRRYGGSDTAGLVATTRWRDRKSAARYEHVVVSEESRRASGLPVPKQKGNRVHGFSTNSNAEFRLRSPKNAGKAK